MLTFSVIIFLVGEIIQTLIGRILLASQEEKNDDDAKLHQRSWLIPLFSGDSPKNWYGSVTVRHRNSPQIAPAWQPTYIPQAYIALCTLLLRVIYSRDIGEIAANTHVVDGGTLPWVKGKHLQKYYFNQS